jgi:OOP family OmpA-OmpF porin
MTVGVEYGFGRKAGRRAAPQDDQLIDTDGDGVLDIWDDCPNTPPGVQVTSRGCELKNVDVDSDGDRVFDHRDDCPNTPPGVPVDPRGCPQDTDRDGVTTDKDRCPGSRPGAEVNEFGCENDNDNDGVPDHRDDCLNTRRGVEVDVYGCEIGDVIELPGVNFQSGSDLLLPGAEELIEVAAQTLKANPNLRIEVVGHTDNTGRTIDNQGLSERRAKTVFDFLFVYGVDPARLSYRGFGETRPIADNTTPEGRAKNRRVELRVIRD